MQKSRKEKIKYFKSGAGFSLIEVVVGTSIILIVLVGLVSAYNLFLGTAIRNTEKIQSAYLLEEGLEAIRSIRDEGWDANIGSLSSSVNYGLEYNGSKWVSTSTIVYIDNIFFRHFDIADVRRDINDDIVSTGGILDPNTKFFTINVSWSEGGATTTKFISAYLSKIF